MSLFALPSPALDGGLVTIDDGLVRARSIRIPTGSYALPFWVRTGSGLVVKVSELPYQGVLPAGSLEVLSSDPAGGGIPTPDFEFDWDLLPSTAAMQAALADQGTNLTYGLYAGQRPGESILDTGLSTPWGGTKALKVRYFDRTSDPNTTEESQIGRIIQLGMTLPEMWIQWYARWEPDWMTDVLQNGTNFDHKTFFYNQSSGSGRWETKYGKQGENAGGDIKCQIENVLENQQIGNPALPTVARSPHTTGAAVAASSCWDGLFHENYAHLKIESAPSANDGAYEFWLDGQKRVEQKPINTGSTGAGGGFTSLTCSSNLNHKNPPDQSMWFGRIRVWATDPGIH